MVYILVFRALLFSVCLNKINMFFAYKFSKVIYKSLFLKFYFLGFKYLKFII